MSEDSMVMCLIAFVIGYLVSRMTRGNGLSICGQHSSTDDRGISVVMYPGLGSGGSNRLSRCQADPGGHHCS